jgi:hypothetical protein
VESLANDSLNRNSERLVLVSDASTEAERLIASMRVRKVKVRDVPLMLLAGRVEAQKPMLVICDGQAPKVIQAIEKMRQGVWGAKVELLLLGIDAKTVDTIRSTVADIDTRLFARPIDVYSVLQRVEEILGESEDVVRGGGRSMASLPRVGQNSISAPGRSVTPATRRARSSIPQLNGRAEPPPPIPASEREVGQTRTGSIPPISEANIPESAPIGSAAVGRMSEELESLLQDADRRLGPGPVSMQPLSLLNLRMTPEQELDAILPADVLSALDEPIDLDDDDETSHPVGRSERDSSMAPRDEPVAVFSLGATNAEASPERGTGTSPSDEDTPVGRPGGRRFTTASGSEPPSAVKTGSVLTPVPASVRTHNTHLGQPSTVQGSSPTASEPTDGAVGGREIQRAADDLRENAFLEGGSVLKVSDPRKGTNESVVPGTNPAFFEPESAKQSDVSSTTPPHPTRARSDDAVRVWASLEDEPSSFGRSESRVGVDSTGFVARREDASGTSTSPPLGAMSRSLHQPDRELVSPESRTRLEPYAGSDSRASRRVEPVESRSSVESRASVRMEHEPRPLSEPRSFAEPRSSEGGAAEGRPTIDIPTALGKGDVVRALARCVRGRYSGALAIEDDAGIRRVVLREGDFVMVASGIDGESLVAFLIQRGDLEADAARLTRKLPQFGRHAGAALIAHGYLRQDELWPVLRAHAEWLLGRAIGVQQGSAGLEGELSARLQAEPAVFGGTTGAEVLVEIVRRSVSPELAVEALGGPKTRVTRGPLLRLLSECALLAKESQLVERAEGMALDELIKQAQAPDFAAAVYALVELSVLETFAPTAEPRKHSEGPPPRDGLDDNAVRGRVASRRALVDEGDYFSLLGIAHDATGYEVRHAYLSLRREFEPARLLTAATADLREDVDLVIDVLDEAYEVLRDSTRRERYRRALEAAPR